MAAVTIDGEEKICFRFNQGLCKNKNCKYVHKMMSEQQKKDTGFDKDRKDSNKKTKLNNKNKLKNSVKNNNSSGTNGMHNPSSVTAIPFAIPEVRFQIQIQMVYQNNKCIQCTSP